MTSKILLSNRTKEDMRHRLGVGLITVVYFLIVILMMAIQVQNAMGESGSVRAKVATVITSYLVPNGYLIVGTILLSIMMGVSAFAYLHSRQKVDCYHALPIRRKELYSLINRNCFTLFAALQGITLIIQLIFSATLGYGSGQLVAQAISSWICYVIIFEANFLLTALSMIMTGNTVVGIMGTGVFMTWFPILWSGGISSLSSTFFKTYVAQPEWLTYLEYGSPGFTAFCLSQGMKGEWNLMASAVTVFILLLWIVVLRYLTVKLFEKRPSEAAGNAMAFPKWNPVIKFCIAVPCGIIIGNFFGAMLVNHEKMGTIFGSVIGSILVTGIIEAIFQMDPKALIARKKEMGCVLAGVIVILGTFTVDLYGYDKYQPKPENIESVMIEESEVYYFIDKNGEYDDGYDKRLRGVTGTEKDIVIEVLKTAVSESGDSKDSDKQVEVSYYLKGGQKKQRRYFVKKDFYDQLKAALYKSNDYKKAIYGVYGMEADRVAGMHIYHSSVLENEFSLNQSDRKTLLGIYREELLDLTYEQIKNNLPYGKMYISYTTVEEGDHSEECYIYPSFKKTIAFLQEKGAVLGEPDLADMRVKKIVITKWQDGGIDKEYEKEITDEKLLEEVKGELYNLDMVPNDYSDMTVTSDGKYSVAADVSYGSGSADEISVTMKQETLEKLLNAK